MASIEWNDITEITQEEAKQDVLNSLQVLGFNGTAWQPFSIGLTFVELSAELRAMISKYAVYFKSAFMAETATGETLTRVARSFYKKNRNPSVTTQILATLACDATHNYSIDVGELVFVNNLNATYRNIEGNSLVYPVAIGPNNSVQFLIEAEVGGVAGNVADALVASAVTIQLQSTLAGVTVTAHKLERSGLDEESDARLRERCQLAWAMNLPKLGLIDEGVKASALEAAPAVTTVAVNSTNPRGVGTFDVYIAGLDATASDDDVLAVQEAVDAQTFGRKNTPKTAKVYKAPIVPIDIAGTVYFKGSLPGTVQAVVESALLEYFRAVPPGGSSFFPGPQHIVPLNDLESVIREAAKTAASSVTVKLSNPTSDVGVVQYGKVVRGDWSGITYQLIAV